MGFTDGISYTRDEISAELRIPRDDHAVIIGKAGKALAIVIAANGHHPSGKQYKNELTSTSLLMHGEKDWRGKRLEQSATPILLFYSHASNGEYRYEGKVLWVKTTVYANSDPLREFTRTSKE